MKDKKKSGFFVTMGSMIGESSGWWVVRWWSPIAGPFSDHEDAVLAMMVAQNAAS